MQYLRLISFSGLCLYLVGCAAAGRREESSRALVRPPTSAFRVETNPATIEEALAGSKGVVTRSLETMRAMAEAGQLKTLGFASVEEARSATLGDPVPILTVRLDQLREYKQGSDPTSLVSAVSTKVLYPVQVGQTTRSSITIARSRRGWEPVSFGGNALSNMFAMGRRKSPAATFVVVVPALNAFFGGAGRGAGMTLTPLEEYASLGLKAFETLPAAQVFERLVKPAREHNGLPS